MPGQNGRYAPESDRRGPPGTRPVVATLLEVEEVKGGGLQLTVGGVIEREGSDKPVCVLESLTRLYG